MPAAIVDRMPWTEEWLVDRERKRVTFMFERNTDSKERDCSSAMAKFLHGVRDQKVFRVLDGWRSELYSIYGPGRELVLRMERSATPLFGVVTYGVHMTAFVREGHDMKIWVPKRAKTKQTYPGMMDNTVAGGLNTGEKPFNCLIREAQEEASLPEAVVRSAKPCGTLTYFHVRDARAGGETGLCQPECQYLYDLELSSDTIPTPSDNEAVDFQLLSVEEVQMAMGAGEFKLNCALVLLEFFVRHGILTAENEPDYIEIVARLHRRLEFPTA
jgi:8-oxo-dGTP pyrophosphatase MutT (NUDIX family)